ncbi:MAG: rRNA maturation RNase YbeY [Gammaproteobacteria bacterium]|nr:MAG: rRNA maturation RNase YbeY [Gammaproteobacteria bacterium]
MTTQLDIQVACAEPVPDEDEIRRFVTAALADHHNNAELSIRLVSEDEMTALNEQYRNKSGSTNVLSFPADLPPELGLALLGDIVICAAVVEREARVQNKDSLAHWAHMLIHGCLHLQGYDHIEHNDAERMEALEVELLANLGFSNPYIDNIDDFSNHMPWSNSCYDRRAQ